MTSINMTSINILNRDGLIEVFNINRVELAITKCLRSVNEDVSLSKNYSKLVEQHIQSEMSVEDIQDIVEKVLEKESPIAGKAYILYREEKKKIRKQNPKFSNPDIDVPWGSVGYITYKRTYSQRKDLSNPASETEEFKETVERVCKAVQNQLHCNFTRKELSSLYYYLMNLKASVAGRFLWQLGMETVNKLGLMSLQNCAYTSITKIDSFEWIFDSAMLGVGIGFSVSKKHVSSLPSLVNTEIKIKHERTNDADFIVPDSREGWVTLIHKIMKSYFVKGKSFTYSTILVRNKGAPIKTFGGISSGPDTLILGVEQICNVLNLALGRQLTTIEVYDIVCIIASIVVSGNVRRVALIAIGDSDDLDFLRVKRWDLGNIPNWRAYSNNSVYCDDVKDLPEEFWEGYKGNGEPYGLINLRLTRSVGRLKDGTKYGDPLVEGFNPCAEQGLADRETCCLAEIYLPRINSYAELEEIAILLYRINKHSLNLSCHQKSTENTVRTLQRMGISVTGYLETTSEQKSWLSDLYEKLREYDEEYSKLHNFNTSIKITTCKPSGTLSLLPGVTPGCHPAIYRYMIRRIRMDNSSNLVNLCRDHGYPVEYEKKFDGKLNYNTSIVEFPYKYSDNAVLASNMTAIDQLKVISEIQTNWSDNSVSCTIYYRLEELPEIRKYLEENYRNSIKTCSFLLHSDHGYSQAPYEEITKEEYERRVRNCNPIKGIKYNVIAREIELSNDCVGGECPIK